MKNHEPVEAASKRGTAGSCIPGRACRQCCLAAVVLAVYVAAFVLLLAVVASWLVLRDLVGKNAEPSPLTYVAWRRVLSSSGPLWRGWEIPAVYTYVAYSDSYSEALDSLGVPTFVQSFLIKAPTLINVSAPQHAEGGLNWAFKRGPFAYNWNSSLNAVFEVNHTLALVKFNCTEDPFAGNVLRCTEEQRHRSKLVARYEFFRAGFVRDAEYEGTNTTAVRVFQKRRCPRRELGGRLAEKSGIGGDEKDDMYNYGTDTLPRKRILN